MYWAPGLYRIFNAMTQIVPHTSGKIALVIVIMYIYSSLGIHLFGGILTKDINLNAYKVNPKYVFINFNNFGNSFITVFHLLIVNNYN